MRLHRWAGTAFLASSALGASSWPVTSYKTELFQPPELKVHKTGETAPGYLVYTPNSQNATDHTAIIMKEDGDLVWVGSSDSVQNLEVQTLFGKKVLTYWTGVLIPPIGYAYGKIVILDETYKELYTICPSGMDIIGPNPKVYPGNIMDPCYLHLHEAYITKDNTIMAQAFNLTNLDLTSVGGPKDGWGLDSLFYEIDIKTNKILFSWSLFDHLDVLPITKSFFVNTTGPTLLNLGGTLYGSDRAVPWDPFHLNSVQGVEGGYLISSRHYAEALFIDKGTGDVRWSLNGVHGGDFTLGPDIYFEWQHDIRMHTEHPGDKQFNLTIFNNNNAFPLAFNGTNATTGLELAVNLESRTASLLRKPYNPMDTIFTIATGSTQILKNSSHILLGYGVIPIIGEYDANDNSIYQAQFGPKSIDVNDPIYSYRTFKSPWVGRPYYAPKGIVEQAPSGCDYDVYMSWNGATEVSSWKVFGNTVHSMDGLKLITEVKSTSFETKVTVPQPDGYKYFLVEASSSTKSLRNSTIFGV